MEFNPDISCVQGNLVSLPGGHDKEGRPIILISIPVDAPPIDVVPSVQYLLSIFSTRSKSRGFTVIIDARKCTWKIARLCIRQVNVVCVDSELAQLIVLRPDAFWDKQRVETCTNSQKFSQEVVFIPRSRLNKFVESSQLPLQLGGQFIYNHEKWIENRQKVEEFYSDVNLTLKELELLHQHILNTRILNSGDVMNALNTTADMAESTRMLVHNSAETGRELLQNIEYENRTRKFASDFESMSTPQETLDTIEKIAETLEKIKSKRQLIEESRIDLEKSFIDTKDVTYLKEGVVKVTNWILGPAENLLNSQQKVGFDVTSAEDLRREHEALEMLCWDTYGAYAELIHKINSFNKSNKKSKHLKDLVSQKDFMDFVCKSFALRLERRRNILITSLRFFRLVSEYFDKTGEVFDSLVMADKSIDFTTADKQLKELQEGQIVLDSVKRELVKEGEKLSDMLSMPVKDALGRELTVDYSEDIINIMDILDATVARKNIFSDSVELQKLTLEQVTHINSYEMDVSQAIQWLDDLFCVMLKDHGHVGCTVQEIQAQKDEHQVFQETAKGTYSYGYQLLNASYALRQSCKLPLHEHEHLSQSLRTSWFKLLSISQEQMTRLRVSAVFHRSVDDHCNQLRDLRESVATIPFMDLVKKRARVRYYFCYREKLLVEVGRMVRLGKLLRTRLKEPLHCLDESMSDPSTFNTSTGTSGDNEIAVETISERLSEVTGLAEELDQALKSAQQDCSVLTSTSTSTTADTVITPIITLKRFEDCNSEFKPVKPDELKSDDEFQTASDCTLQHSRSSSYNTASECENRYSPWWEFDKNINENLSKEKMILAVGLPTLPLAQSVLKPSPEVPPGKIVHEVTETTHLKVQHSHTMGVQSFVLTSETVRDKNNEGYVQKEELVKVTNESGQELLVPVQVSKNIAEDDFVKRMREVGTSCEDEAWNKYHCVTKQAIKGFI